MKTEEKNNFKTNKPEEGDIFTARYSAPREFKTGNMKYPSYSLGVIFEGEELYLKLTGTQYDDLIKKGDIDGKQLKVRSYNTATRDNCLAFDVVEDKESSSSSPMPLKPKFNANQEKCLNSIKDWAKAGASKSDIVESILMYFGDSCDKEQAAKYYEEYK